jgi:hypothetical protein
VIFPVIFFCRVLRLAVINQEDNRTRAADSESVPVGGPEIEPFFTRLVGFFTQCIV